MITFFLPLSTSKELLSTFTKYPRMTLLKLGNVGVYAFFLICSGAEFYWTEIVQIWRNTNRWTSNCNWLEYNGELFEKKSSYGSKTNWLCIQAIMVKVPLSGMHPFDQILNFDDQMEFQNRGFEHMHTPNPCSGCYV